MRRPSTSGGGRWTRLRRSTSSSARGRGCCWKSAAACSARRSAWPPTRRRPAPAWSGTSPGRRRSAPPPESRANCSTTRALTPPSRSTNRSAASSRTTANTGAPCSPRTTRRESPTASNVPWRGSFQSRGPFPEGLPREDFVCRWAAARDARRRRCRRVAACCRMRKARIRGCCRFLVQLAQTYERAGRWSEAAAAWRETSPLDPTAVPILGEANAEEHLGHRERAISLLQDNLRSRAGNGQDEIRHPSEPPAARARAGWTMRRPWPATSCATVG